MYIHVDAMKPDYNKTITVPKDDILQDYELTVDSMVLDYREVVT